MEIKHKAKYSFLSNEVLNQYHKELESVMKTKSLYLRSHLCVEDLSTETGIPAEHVKQVLSEKLNLTFFEFISGYKIGKAKHLLTKINHHKL